MDHWELIWVVFEFLSQVSFTAGLEDAAEELFTAFNLPGIVLHGSALVCLPADRLAHVPRFYNMGAPQCIVTQRCVICMGEQFSPVAEGT